MSDRWQRVSALLDELFELDPAARDARLLKLQAEDPALAEELRRVLAADARSGLLDGGVAQAANTLMNRLAQGDDDAAAAPARAGRDVGHYKLLERVGSGGMGEVWRGERTGGDFEQQVAVKLIRPLLDSPALRERFARERRILARLDHPNIARLLDGGVAEDGTPWYAMEYVRGVPIVDYAREHALDVRQRVELLLQACDAVANAQSLLVVHRDIKPSNVLVDAQGRARVLDFGIARLLDDSGGEALTGTGVRVFSPAYAAPEQIRGDAVGTAADVYGLGAVLYELLTGEVPHPRRGAVPERLLAGLADETAPHPARTLRERSTQTAATRGGVRDIGADLDLIVATALQPDPARRYAGAAQFADDLRRWLDGRPIAAQPDTAAYRMRKFVARHRLAVGSASAVLLALLAGLAVALWQASVARDLARRADAEAQRANSEAQRANAEAQRANREAAQALALTGRVRHVKDFFMSAFIQADPMRRSEGSPVTVPAAFDDMLERARTELAADPVLQADVFDDFGEIRANQGRFDEAKALFRQALEVAEREYGPDHPAVAESLVNLAVVADYEGQAKDAREKIDRAVAILEKDDGGDPIALANALNSQASLVGGAGDTAAAIPIEERSLALYRKHAPDSPALIGALTNLGTMHSNAGNLDASDRVLNEVVARLEKQLGKNAPALWPTLTTLAANAYVRGDLKTEAEYTERALQLARENFPDAHPWVASSLVDRGLQIAKAGDWKRGEAMMQEGVAMYDALESPEVVAALRRLAIAQRLHDDNEGALASIERAHEVCAANQSTGTMCQTVRANRALMWARTGRAQEALAEADAAIAALAADDTRYSEQGQAREARAAALVALGRQPEAVAELEGALALLTRGFGPGHPETRRVQASLDRLR